MSEGKSEFGYALNSQVGLAMVGGNNGTYYALTSESTTDGINIDSSAVADFEECIYGNCLVSVNESMLLSLGGVAIYYQNEKRIAVHTIGNGEWEV